MLYKQNDPYGCGLYSVANIFELPNFVTPERIELSKKGNVAGQLTIWLNEDDLKYSIDYWYYNHEGGKLPEKFFEYLPDKGHLLPVMFTVKSLRGKAHMIGGRINHLGDIEIFDSLKDESFIIPFNKINNYYHEIYGFLCFVSVIETSKYIILYE